MAGDRFGDHIVWGFQGQSNLILSLMRRLKDFSTSAWHNLFSVKNKDVSFWFSNASFFIC